MRGRPSILGLFTTTLISKGADLGLSQLNSIPSPAELLEVRSSPGPDNSLTRIRVKCFLNCEFQLVTIFESWRNVKGWTTATKISIIRKGNLNQEDSDILCKTLEHCDVTISGQKCGVFQGTQTEFVR